MTVKYKLEGRTPVKVEDVLEWAMWFEKADRIVAQTLIADARVSTVFLGLDHSWGVGHQPLLFETMVFGGEMDGEQRRYATWEDAERGHQAMVKVVKAATRLH